MAGKKQPTPIAERDLPHNLDAEKALLGAILVHQEHYDTAAALLKPEQFYRVAHQRIFTAMGTLRAQTIDVEFVTLKAELLRAGDLDEVGGPAYISSLASGVPRATNVKHYASLIAEAAALRDLIGAANQILTKAYDAEEPASVIVSEADRALLALQGRGGDGHLRALSDTAVTRFKSLEWRVEHKGELRGLDTGYPAINEITLGLRAGDLDIIAARPSIGKAQPLDSSVLLSTGQWVKMGDLRVGDELASADGEPSFVTGIFPQGVHQAFRVTFVDGRSVECSGDHLWSVHTTKLTRRDHIWATNHLSLKLSIERYRSRIGVPLMGGDFGSSRDWPVDPWLLGFLIGDGSFRGTTLRFSTADAEIIEQVRAKLPDGLKVRHVAKYDYAVVANRRGAGNELLKALGDLGLRGAHSHTKFIPGVYFTGDYDDRLELLQGLLDSDGWAQGAVCYTTVSEQLASDVQALARSIGAVVRVRSKARSYRYRGHKLNGRTAYELVITHQRPDTLFTLDRKRKRARVNVRRQRLTIVSVEPTRMAMMQCISVSHSSGLYVTDGYTLTHNTTLALNIGVHAAQAGKRVAVFSLEMTREQLEDRILSQLSRVALSRIQSGHIGQTEWAPLAVAITVMDNLPLAINDRAGQTAGEIRASCRRLLAEFGALDLVIVDYVQLMVSGLNRKGSTRTEELSDAAMRLKDMAKELAVPVILVSQLRRVDGRPKIEDLRESGALEQVADIVGLLHRRDHRVGGTTEFIVAKHRNGRCGTYYLTLDLDTTTFTDGGEPEPEPSTQEKTAASRRIARGRTFASRARRYEA